MNITASSVTTTRFEDDGETAPVEKEYVIVAGSLYVHHWGSADTEVNFDRFTRVGNPPMPGAAPLPLQGTWKQTNRWTHEEYGEITQVHALTLTASRAIEAATIYDANSGELVRFWSTSSGWSSSGTTITRTFVVDDDVMRSLDKEYIIVGDFLAVHVWGEEEPTQSFRIWERVHDPLPGGLAGIWNGWCSVDHRLCGRELSPWTVTFGESFSYEFRSPPSFPEQAVFRITGSWEDDLANNFVYVTWEDVVDTAGGSPVEDFDASRFIGHRGRYAYAPTGIPGHLVFSVLDWELSYDEETSTWKENVRNPYGAYWMRLERQSQ